MYINMLCVHVLLRACMHVCTCVCVCVCACACEFMYALLAFHVHKCVCCINFQGIKFKKGEF